MSADEIAETIP